MAVLTVVVLASVAALAYAAIFDPKTGLLGGSQRGSAGANLPDRPSGDPEEATVEEPPPEEPPPEEPPPKEPTEPKKPLEPTPGYNMVRTPDGGLTVEVPQSWGVEIGEDSEKEAGPNTWSYHTGEYLTSSITTAPNLDAWYSTGTSGAYVVAAKTLAQYSDYELTHSLLYANRAENCATTGPYEDYVRPPYSGKMQTWYECGPDGATTFAVTAAPESRECVAVLDVRISDEADREAIEHLVGTVEVDCGLVTSQPLATSSASASP